MTWNAAAARRKTIQRLWASEMEPEDFWQEAETLGRALAATLAYYQVLGVEGLSISSPSAPPDESEPAARPDLWAPAARDLDHLAWLTAGCRACPRARAREGEPAFGRGAPRPRLVLVGLDPGLFDGPEAALLATILEKGLKLAPDQFYLTSILKCPAGPEEDPAELAEALSACLAVTLRELALLRPQVILALGETPGRALTGQEGIPLGLLRDRTFRLDDEAWLRVTFSLEQLLASPDLKLEAWKTDFLKIKKVLDKTICGS